MSKNPFEAMRLAAPVLQALKAAAYDTPTPIQAQSIPPQLEGRDLMGCAQTGTGKTAAFALPILSHLAERRKRPERHTARVLVLVPTRELASQVSKSFSTYGQNMRLSQALVFGGVSQKPQVRNLSKGVDLLIATPGRLLDLLDQGEVALGAIEFLVLDEVDRMLDMGFIHDVRRIAKLVPKDRQTALFTATFTPKVEALAREFVNNPVKISVSPDRPVLDKIEQQVCHVRQENKLALLEVFLRRQKREERPSTIVFCRTKYAAEKLSRKINRNGFQSDSIHGDKTQRAREVALDKFRKGKVSTLIATDVAARGLEVRDISLVINYDLPESADSYVHRVGRTARAEASGHAVSFCTDRDTGLLAQIEHYIGNRVPLKTDQPFNDSAV